MTEAERNILRQNVLQILQNHAKAVYWKYREKWIPNDRNIEEAYSLFRAPEGFEPYTLEEIIRRQRVFWSCKDDWIVECKHNFTVFVKHIHRWIVTDQKHNSVPNETETPATWRCPECGNELLTPGEICQKCFPTCPDCGHQHLPDESCETFRQRYESLKKLFSRTVHRTNKLTIMKEIIENERKAQHNHSQNQRRKP